MSAKTILLLPNAEHAHLLEEGPCGAMPPMMTRCYNERSGRHYPEWDECGPDCAPEDLPYVALVLAYQGEPVWLGCLAALPPSDYGLEFLGLIDSVVAYLRSEGRRLYPGLPGTIVVLDADGREVTP